MANYSTYYPDEATWGPYGEIDVELFKGGEWRNRFSHFQNYIVYDGSESAAYLSSNELQTEIACDINHDLQLTPGLRGSLGSSNLNSVAPLLSALYTLNNDTFIMAVMSYTWEQYTVSSTDIDNEYFFGYISILPMLTQKLELEVRPEINTSKYSILSEGDNSYYMTLGLNYYLNDWFYGGTNIRSGSDFSDFNAIGGGIALNFVLFDGFIFTTTLDYSYNEQEYEGISGTSKEINNIYLVYANLSFRF